MTVHKGKLPRINEHEQGKNEAIKYTLDNEAQQKDKTEGGVHREKAMPERYGVSSAVLRARPVVTPSLPA